jgi:CubicO group peptidase (beta-lactamase class C family)
MRIASVTKHFTCLAYMLLCEDGKAGLHDTIGAWLPELHPVTHSISMWQLMSHTSGLYDARTIRFLDSGMVNEVPIADLVALYRRIDDLNFAPGTSWAYCNGAYEMLALAIERISGQPLEEFFQRRIFGSVGMYDTLLRRSSGGFVANSATQHTKNPEGGFLRGHPFGVSAGAGGIVSTIRDMLRWLAHMDSPVVGSDATWAAMRTAQTLPNGTSSGYGLGLYPAQPYRGIETLQHAGGSNGFNAQLLKVPAAGLDIVVMVNRDDQSAFDLGNRILDACLPELEAVHEPATTIAVNGAFRSPQTGRVVELRESAIPPGSRIGQVIALD